MKLVARLFILFLVVAVLIGASGAGIPQARTASAATQAATESGVFPRTVKDGMGNDVTIPARPMRIASAALAADEVLFSMIDPARLIAVTDNALDPAESNVADVASKISNHITAKSDPEAIIALRADLIFISPFTDAGVIKQLKAAYPAVFLLNEPLTFKDIESNILLMGAATGNESRAADIVNKMESRLADIAAAVKGVKPLAVLYYAPDGYSDGPGTTVDEVITRAGGINAVTAGGIKDAFPQLSDEFLVKQDPDVILLAGFNSYSPGFVDKFNSNPNFQTLKAIKNKRVVVANDAHLASISQYVVDGVADVAMLLYPDAFPVATGVPAPTASR